MRLQIQKGNFCLLYATAMLLDETPERLIKDLGHNGKRQPWLPNDPIEINFNIQEIVDLALRRGIALVEIDACPANANIDGQPGIPIWEKEKWVARFMQYITSYKSLIRCRYHNRHRDHIVACDGEMIYDPIGRILDFDTFFQKYVVECAYVAVDTQ